MKPNTIRFPGFYHALVRTLRVDFQPSHFFDLVILGIVGAALFASVIHLGGVAQDGSVIAPRLVAVAAVLHIFSQLIRSAHGVRVRWTGFLFAPFAIWLLVESTFLSPCAWRGREQAAVALTAALSFWIVLHHLRHRAHRWCLVGGLGLIASVFGSLVIFGGAIILPRLAQRVAGGIYAGQQTGPFPTPGEFGAFLLLAVFPVAAVFLSPSLRPRRRVAAGLTTALGLSGLWMTHHAPTWYGFIAGASILGLLLIERKRIACLVAAGLWGAAFFVPKFTEETAAGLFRADAQKTPLAEAAMKIFAAHPATGAGSGGFPAAFEALRPAGWDLDPLTAGGFFHQLAAENGLVGLILLIPPAVLIWVLFFRVTWKTPVRLIRYNPQFKKKHLYTPEERIAGAGILAGTLGAAVSLSFDYAAPSLALAMSFAILGAIAARASLGGRAVMTVKPAPTASMILRALPTLVPALVFVACTFPVFESAANARRAEDILEFARRAPSKTIGGQPQESHRMLERRYRAQALESAENSARTALRAVPDNARAEAALSAILAEHIRDSGRTDDAGECLTAALGADAHSGGEILLRLPLVTAYRIAGLENEARKHLAVLRAAAPENAPLAIEEARTMIARGESATALPLLDAILRKEPWNKEARRLRQIVGITPGVSEK